MYRAYSILLYLHAHTYIVYGEHGFIIKGGMAVSLGAALGRNDEDARPTGCGAEPREIFLPFLLQNRPFSKEIVTFRTPI